MTIHGVTDTAVPASPPDLATAETRRAQDAARAICRRHARSFYFASFFLPKSKRQHAYNVYAFCRLLDDAADEARSPAEMESRLHDMSQALADAYAGRTPTAAPPDPATPADALALAAFARTVRTCDIPRRYFEDLVIGCRMDQSVTRYADWEELQRYCYHVAGVVGLIMCRIFELRDTSGETQAIAMGNAMQLTNILRDVKEDLARGRIYLPADEMARFGVTEAGLRAGCVDDGFRDLMRFQIARTRELYREGSMGLAMLPGDGSRLTAGVMATLYGGILGAIEQADYDVFTARRGLTLRRKLAMLPQAWRLSR